MAGVFLKAHGGGIYQGSSGRGGIDKCAWKHEKWWKAPHIMKATGFGVHLQSRRTSALLIPGRSERW